METCAADPCFWISTFCWTKNPDLPDLPKIPFILYEDFQDAAVWEIVNAIEMGYDLLIEKSRKMGLSWLVLYVFLWYWLFRDNADFKAGSWKEDYVDKIGDMDTLFEKLRFALRFMPLWMVPAGYNEKMHGTYNKLKNPKKENTIVGEAPTVHFASGGRRKAMLLDELSKWDPGAANGAWTATASVTKCRIVVATPFGSGNKYAQLANGTNEKIRKITLHWTLHPEFSKDCYYLDGNGTKIPIPDSVTAFRLWEQNRQQPGGIIVRSPWYDAECSRRSEADVAQELDIDYLKSGFPFFSIAAINKQRIWTPIIRKNPFMRIPYGNYVMGKIINLEHKFTFIETQAEPWLNVFEEPEGHMEYALGGDTAEGLVQGDECFAVIRNKYTRSVVATIHGHYKPDVFAQYVWLVSKWYNDCLTAVENAVFGYTVNRDLEQLGSNLYYTKKEETKDGIKETPKRGFTTDMRTRPQMLANCEEEVRKSVCEIRDGKIIAQMKTFIKNPKKAGRPEADTGMNDDGVIAFSISGQIIQENPYKPRKDSDILSRAAVDKVRGKRNAGFGF